METEKTSMTEPPKFKFLDDNCSDCDLTADKTHQRIADQLYELITSGNPEGMTIGLEGDWGSGKSTVIELLRQKLAENDKISFCYIDAWEHEGDPLRRAFLEALIEQYPRSKKPRKNIDKAIAEIKKKLSHRKIQKTSPTRFGFWLGVAALFAPIGLSIVSALIPHVTIHWTGRVCWKFWMGLLLALVPVGVYGIQGVRYWWANKKGHKGKTVGFNLLSSATAGPWDSTATFEEERSSLEFSHCFDKIIEAIASPPNRIVIVIDNLDRIDSKSALRVWSTLQTFVQRKNPLGKNLRQDSKWIIVPYAGEGLGRIWDDELEESMVARNDKKEEGTEENQGACELNGESCGAKRLASFMDKTFDLRIHVPNMLLGDWQAFAKECILKLEPKFSTEDIGIVLNTLVWTRKRLEDAPSPRQIKLYVNHVALLCQLHRERVSLDAICFYVITKYLDEGLTDEDIKKALLDGGIDDRSLPPYSGPLASEMAAIVFNTDVKKAMRLLLEPTLRKELENREIDSLQASKERFGDVFDDVIGHILSHTPSRDFSGFLALIQRACSGLSKELGRYAFQRMKTEREAITRNISSLGHANVLALIEVANRDPELSRELAKKYISERIVRFSHSEYPFNDIIANLPEISLGTFLLQKLEETKNAAKQDVKIPYQELIDGKFAFDKLDRKEMEQFVAYISDLDAADKHLAEILASPPKHWPQRMSDWFGVLTARGLTSVESIIQALETILNGNENILQTDSKDAFLEMLVALESIPYSKRPVERIRKMLVFIGNRVSPNESNTCLHFLLAKYQENDPVNTGAMEARFTHVLDSYQKFMNRDDAEAGAHVYQYTALSEEREWLARMVARPRRRLGGQIVKAALKANDPYLFRVPEPYAFASNVFPLLEGEDRRKLVDSFFADPNRIQVLSESNGERLTGVPMMCLELLSRCQDAALRRKLMDRCVSELHQKKSHEWKATFALGMPELFVWLEQNGVSLSLGAGFSDFFQQYLYEILPKDRADRSSFEELSVLYRSMNAASRAQFSESVGRRLLDCRLKVPPGERHRFLVEIPDYSGWLQEAQTEIARQANGLVGPQGLEKLELLSEIMFHQRNRGSWWDAIRLPLAEPLRHLADLPNPHIKKVVQRIEGNLELIERTDNSGKDTDDHAGGEELWAQSGREKGGSAE